LTTRITPFLIGISRMSTSLITFLTWYTSSGLCHCLLSILDHCHSLSLTTSDNSSTDLIGHSASSSNLTLNA
jgi:hypothetical protein